MEIKIAGFELRCDGSISLSDFFTHLLPLSGKQFTSDQIFGIVDKGTNYVGINVLIKDMKAFLTRKNLGEKITISAETIADNEDVVVANFFLINKKTFRGLYSSYYGSCTLNKFLYFLNMRFKSYKQQLLDNEINAPNKPADETERKTRMKKAIKKHSGHFKYAIIERREALESRILQLKELKNFTFEYLALDTNTEQFVALAKRAKRISHSVTFGQASTINTGPIKNIVADIVKRGLISKGTIKGTDPDNHEVVYKTINDYDVFEKYDYDDIIKTVSIDFNNLKHSILSSNMAKILEEASTKPFIKAILTA